MARPMRPNRLRQQTDSTIVPMPPGAELTIPTTTRPTLPPAQPAGAQPVPGRPEAATVMAGSSRSPEEQNRLEQIFEEARSQAALGFAGRYGAREFLGPSGQRQQVYYHTSAPLGLEGAGTTYDLGTYLGPGGLPETRKMFGIDIGAAPASSAGRIAQAFGGQALFPTTIEQAAAGRTTLLDEEGARRELFSLPTNDVAQVKLGLVAIGVLEPENVGLLNVKDISSNPKIQTAFNRLVGVAQANGLQWQQLLTRMVRNGETFTDVAGGGSPTNRPAVQYRVTNPDDIKAIAQDVALRTIGRGLASDEANMFVTSYQDMERRAQQALAMGATEVQQAPSIDVAAETMLREQFEDEYDIYQMGNTLDTFQQVLAGQL